jgi:GT2 family glycosyltransferase
MMSSSISLGERARPFDAPRPAAPTLSVIIPVLDGGDRFRRCLESLRAASPPPAEIIVVVDGGSDDAKRASELGVARVIRLPDTGGPARARNVGARAAHGDVLVFLDADVTITPDTLALIATAFREPAPTAVFGSYDDEPAETNFLSQYKNIFHHYIHQTSRETATTFWAGCGAVRRDAFLAMGGFDETYRRASVEDIELGYRLHRAGHSILLHKTLQVKHLKHWRVGSLLRADFNLRAVPWTELILRDRHIANDLNLTFASRAAVVLAYLAVAELVAAVWSPWLFALAGTSVVTMFALDAGVLTCFHQKRGLWFALRAAPWLWLYHLYSGLGFVVGMVRYWTR